MAQAVSDFSELLLRSPKNCWLALNEDESQVVATGQTPEEAQAKAAAAGLEDPLLIWAPETWMPHPHPFAETAKGWATASLRD